MANRGLSISKPPVCPLKCVFHVSQRASILGCHSYVRTAVVLFRWKRERGPLLRLRFLGNRGVGHGLSLGACSCRVARGVPFYRRMKNHLEGTEGIDILPHYRCHFTTNMSTTCRVSLLRPRHRFTLYNRGPQRLRLSRRRADAARERLDPQVKFGRLNRLASATPPPSEPRRARGEKE